ncbi:acyltransferase [Alicyclobacillus cycloheptanicus]|nr:acyltransferase [Alicyclobacillus cycloheptanicus]
MRAFIMLCVLSVHTTSFFNSMNTDMTPAFLGMGAAITALHFTREAFMFITGLVLFVTYYHREFHLFQFWKKRFALIVVPYIVWTVVYILFKNTYAQNPDWSPTDLLHVLGKSLLTGDQFFLYYVVVTMQLYIVFPLLLWGLRKLERWHLHVFIASFLFQLFLMWLNKDGNLPAASFTGFGKYLWEYRDRFILTYQFWFVAGGIMACHYDQILAFANRHVRALRAALLIGLAVLWAHYFYDRLALHEPESMGELVLQPIMIPYSFLVAANMWYAGVQWARRRERPGWRWFSRFVGVGSATSFGIFLLQPFPLSYMERTIVAMHRHHGPAWLHFALWPFCILFVYFTGMVIAYWLGKIPIVSYVVGRKTSRKRPALGKVVSQSVS